MGFALVAEKLIFTFFTALALSTCTPIPSMLSSDLFTFWYLVTYFDYCSFVINGNIFPDF